MEKTALELAADHLSAFGLNPGQIIPDGKVHRYGETDDEWKKPLTAFYIAFERFAVKTGEQYIVIVYGDYLNDIPTDSFCTLVSVTKFDKPMVDKTIKFGQRLAIKNQKQEMEELTGEKFDELKLKPLMREGMYVVPLGFKEKDHFYTSSENRQIVAISAFKQSDFMNLAPIEYWESKFPGGGASRVDWAQATSALMEDARKSGIFQARRVRGAGVWNDEGRVIVNMGDHLLVDGDRVELGAVESRYFYTLGASLPPLSREPLTAEECEPLIGACDLFKWTKPDYGFLMAGALVVSRICGALPVRPHVWITGGAQTGKTTLLEKLIQVILGESMLYVQGATTEAGIRQSLKADAIPVLFDEFESTGGASQERINTIVELCRAAWSDSSALIVKGSSGGNASVYQVRFSAIVSSIRTKLTNDADRSRFAILELAPHGNDSDHWNSLSELLCQIDGAYAERLFARTITLLPVLLGNYRILKSAFAKRASQRFGDQYGMLLAGYSILLQDEPITAAQALKLVEHVSLLEERQEAKTVDHEEALNTLQTKKISFERSGIRYERTVAECLRDARGDIEVNEALQRLGIRVSGDTVAISQSNTELESQIFRNTRWSLTWANSFSRLEGAKRNVLVRIAGKPQRCITVPIATLSL